MRSKQKLRHIHWRTPFTILFAFVAGLAFALGHHYFYASLNDIEVSTAALDQEWNLAIGTAFAFLVRACVVLAVAGTYWQAFWRALQRHTMTIDNIDTLHGLTRDALAFSDVKSLWRHPVLVLIAFLTWTLPFATIVPPATLSVYNTAELSTRMETLPTLNFTTDTMADTTGSGFSPVRGSLGQVYYTGPKQPLQRLTTATAIQGVVPPINGPSLNSSYQTLFDAPTLQCSTTDNASLRQFLGHMMGFPKYPNATYRPDSWYTYQYIAWAPTADTLTPWGPDGNNITELISFDKSSGAQGLSSYLGQFNATATSVFVGTQPPYTTQWDILNCTFFDSTYEVAFEFVNGISHANITRITTRLVPITLSNMISNSGVNPNGGPVSTTYTLTPKQVGYQALIESFGRIVIGSIGSQQTPDAYDGGTTDHFTVESTSVLNTDLAYTNELAPIAQYATVPGQCGYQASRGCTPALNASDMIVSGKDLGSSLEQLFHNMTLALFSASEFTSTDGAPQTNVTVSNIVTKYRYSAKRLALAYGIALLCALVAVVIGGIAILANGVSYSDKFSTILRSTHGLEIDGLGADDDEGGKLGADPLPAEIGRARIKVVDQSTMYSSVNPEASHEH